jgi:hypothetical protein
MAFGMRTITTIGIVLSLAACGVEPGTSGDDTTNAPTLDAGQGSTPPGAGDPADPPTQGGSPTAPTAPATGALGPYFQNTMFWNTDVSTVAKAANSDATIAALNAAGGWGNGNKFQIDFALDVLTANSATPMKTFTPTDDFFSPDCDHVAMPVPTGGDVEDESGYACTGDGDCHLLVVNTTTKKLYEMWRANITSTFQGGCLAVWDLTAKYTQNLRGDQCTSADAAGLPMSPLLFTADEVKAGHIDHAIRFILPNARVKPGYVHPATHATDTTGKSNAPAYGVHLRLRANYPIANLKPAAQVVARALQKYGMYHADGGEIALTAQSDRHTTAKWAGLLASTDLAALKVTDFEVIDHGAVIPLTGDCNRP